MKNINKEQLMDRISSLAKEKGMTLNKIFIESGVGKNFKGNLATANPSLGKLALIANYLDTTVEYLIGDTDDSNDPTKQIQPIVPEVLADLYNSLNDQGKKKLLEYADDLVNSGKYSIDNTLQLDGDAI